MYHFTFLHLHVLNTDVQHVDVQVSGLADDVFKGMLCMFSISYILLQCRQEVHLNNG